MRCSFAGGVLLGLYVAARRRLLEAYVERAERAERERHLLGERAREEERTRLASEMHGAWSFDRSDMSGRSFGGSNTT